MHKIRFAYCSFLLLLVIAGGATAQTYTQVLSDPLTNGTTVGIRNGGSFVSGGWKSAGGNNYIQYTVSPTITYGKLEFDVKGLEPQASNYPYDGKGELCVMYDGSYNNSDSSKGDYDVNPYKFWWRKLGVQYASNGYDDAMKVLTWLGCYHCGGEQYTGRLSWSASTTYRFTVTWRPGSEFKFYRDGTLIKTLNYSGIYAPTTHRIRIGASARQSGIPDAIYSNVKIYRETTPPSVPTNVQAVAQTGTSIKVTWTASTDNGAVGGYKIFRDGAQVATSSTASYTDTGLQPNTTYSYVVSAYDTDGNNSAQSSPPAVASTPGGDTTPPSVPTNVVATPQSPTSIQVTWTASTDNLGVAGYKVFRNGSQVGTSEMPTYDDTGLQPGTSYSYTVSAYDASGNNSAQSSPPVVGTTMVLTSDPLRVSADGHWLEFRGRKVLLIGDSITQGWMELGTNFNQTAYVDALASRGINLLMIWTYMGIVDQVADDRIGYDAPEIWPWVKSGSAFNLDQLNDAYFTRLRSLVDYANSKDIVVLICVHDGGVKWRWDGHPFKSTLGGPLTANTQFVELHDYNNEMPTTYNSGWTRQQKHQYFLEKFCNRLIQATGDLPNVMYEMFNEGEWYNQADHRAFQVHFLDYFKARTSQPTMVNDGNVGGADFSGEPNCDILSYHSPQYSSSTNAVNAFNQYANLFPGVPAKPFFWSETVPGWKGDSSLFTAIRRIVWGAAIGGAGVAFQNDTSFGWDTRTIMAGQATNRNTAYDILGHCARFFNQSGVNLDEMLPQGSLASTGVCLARAGREYVVYTQSSSFTVNMSAATGNFACRFYNPGTGQFQATFYRTGGGTESFTTPGSGDWVLHVKAEDSEPPSVPGDLSATVLSEDAIQLNWSASTDNIGVAGYKIYRNGTQITTTTATSYLNTGLTPSTTYSYTVSAYDAVGNESAQSSPAVATTMEPDLEPPSIPTDVVAVARSYVSIQIDWTASTDNSGVAGYKVFRNGAEVGTTVTNGYLDLGLTPDTTYSYTVSAYDVKGNESAQSSPPAIATTKDSDTDAPSVPTGVSASAVCPTRVKIDWTASTDDAGVEGYKIYQNGNQIGVTTQTTFTDIYGNVLPSTSYSYTVSAYDAAGNDSGESPPSAVATGACASTVRFNISNCSTVVSTTKPYTKVWNQSFSVCDAKYHWNTRAANNAGAGNQQVYYVEGMGYGTGGGGYAVYFPEQSSPSCVTVSSTANHYIPTPGSYTQLKAYFPFPDVFSVEYIELARDSWYDRFAPKVMNVTSDLEDGVYGADQEVDVRITFSEVVNVTGTPRLLLETGDTDRYAVYSSGSGSRTLVFLYTVQADDISDNLDYVGTNSLELDGGTIKDAGGNNATLTLPEPGAPMSLGNNKDIVIAHGPPDEEAPSVPTDVMAAAQSETSIQITWTASTDNVSVKGYRIFRNGVQVGTSNTTLYLDTGLTAATTYSYTVAAYDSAGNQSAESSPAAVATTPDTTPPSVPTDLAAAAVSGSAIEITWSASTDNVGVAGYRIFRNGAEVGTTGGRTSYTDTGLDNATSYTYTVSAFDAASNESAQSAPAAAMTFDVEPPSVPTNVQAAALSPSSIGVTWTASTDDVGVTGYRIYRNGSEAGTSATTSYTDSGLQPDTTYSYTVSAYDGEGNNSAQSSPPAIATTPEGDTVAPSVPTNVQASALSATSITVTWTASTDNVGVAGYNVYRNGALLAKSVTTSYLDAGLQASTSYSYVVSAYDEADNTSEQSSPAAVATTPALPVITLMQDNFDTNPFVSPVRWLILKDNCTPLDAGTDPGVSWSTTENACGSPAGFIRRSNSYPRCLPYQPAFTTAGYTNLKLRFWHRCDGGGFQAYVLSGGTWTKVADVGTASVWTESVSNLTGTVTGLRFILKGASTGQNRRLDCISITGTDGVAPSVPTGVQAVAQSGTTVTVSWAASTDNIGVIGYRVYRNGVHLGGSTTTSYMDGGLQSGGTYSYQVCSYDAAGNNSALSSPAAVVTTPDTVPPSPPANLEASIQTPASIRLSWMASTDNTGVAGYRIFRNSSLIGTTPNTYYVDSGLDPAQSYTYTVTAYDAAGNESAQSIPAAATTVQAISITDAKCLPDSSPVGFLGKIVSAVFDNYFYVEEPDRSAGVRVVPLEMPNGLAVGKTVDVGGTVESSDGERSIGSANVVVSP